MLDEECQDIIVAYSTGNKPLFRSLTGRNPKFQRFVTQIISSRHAESSKIREIVVAKILGFLPNLGVHGYDCIDRKYTPWEIKTEQPSKKLQGSANFHSTSKDNLQKYMNQRILQAGFTNGYLAYVTSYSFAETKLYPRILQLQGRSPIKYGCNQWKDLPSLKLHFLNPEFHNQKYMNHLLYEVIEDLEDDL